MKSIALHSDLWNVLLLYWLEHTAGKFRYGWLGTSRYSPISEKFNEYAEKVKTYLKNKEIRAIVDDRNEKIGRKIRDNEMKRIPYMLIVGERSWKWWSLSADREKETKEPWNLKILVKFWTKKFNDK